jgi:hypothetical protein
MVKKIYVNKKLTDDETSKLEGQLLPTGYYKKIIREDADVYKEDGTILLKFRKNILPEKHILNAYNSMIKKVKRTTTTRGIAGGPTGKEKLTKNNNPIASNIMGYFDTLSIQQKYAFKVSGLKIPICRQTSFTGQYPLEWSNIIPLMNDIDKAYKMLFPKEHAKQLKEARKTKYVIGKTAFSTLTTNYNLQTAAHTDKGDFKKGFGNLVVIENGSYTGGYTGFPQYGIAVDVKRCDFLGMDVHHLHGNTPIIGKGEKYERISLVSYLRQGIVDKCKGLDIVPQAYFDKASLLTAQKKK